MGSSVLASTVLASTVLASTVLASTVLAMCLVLSIDGAGGCDTRGENLQRFQRSERHMGTTFGLVLYAENEATANGAFTAAFARIAELDRMYTDYDLESELSRLSAQAPTPQPVPVSQDLYDILRISRDLSARTGGAFDITLGPLTKLWRRARLLKKPPDAERIREALDAIGYQHLVVHADERLVQLKRPNMRLDLGGIAAGYAADEALKVLLDRGLTRVLVNAGGDIAVWDPPPGETGWRIDIAPLEPQGKPTQSAWITRAGLSTSGDAFQFIEIDGKRYSHILDARTGYGVTQRSSVTVIAPSGVLADALATAVSVLGPKAGLKLIEDTPGAAAYIVAVEDDQVKTYFSSRYQDFTR